MTYDVRRAALEDRPLIERFLRAAHGADFRWKYPDRWEWQFVHNPFRPEDGLPILIAVDDQDVVGLLGLTYVRMRIQGRDVLGTEGNDLFVSSAHRSRGFARQLVMQLPDNTLGMWMAEKSQVIFSELGARRLRPIEIFYRHHRVGDSIASGVGFEFEPLSLVGPRIDSFWERVASSLEPAVARTAAYVQWKYVDQPFANYEVFFARRSGEDRALLVYRSCVPPEPGGGVIADLVCAPEDGEARRACIAFAVNELSGRGAEILVAGTSLESFAGDYRTAGFTRMGEQPVMFRNISDGACVTPGQAWFVGRADSDGDQFPAAAWRGPPWARCYSGPKGPGSTAGGGSESKQPT